MKMIPMSVTCSRDVTKYWLSRAKINQPSYNVQKSTAALKTSKEIIKSLKNKKFSKVD